MMVYREYKVILDDKQGFVLDDEAAWALLTDLASALGLEFEIEGDE